MHLVQQMPDIWSDVVDDPCIATLLWCPTCQRNRIVSWVDLGKNICTHYFFAAAADTQIVQAHQDEQADTGNRANNHCYTRVNGNRRCQVGMTASQRCIKLGSAGCCALGRAASAILTQRSACSCACTIHDLTAAYLCPWTPSHYKCAMTTPHLCTPVGSVHANSSRSRQRRIIPSS